MILPRCLKYRRLTAGGGRAFSLVELLVVIAIIVLLVLITFPMAQRMIASGQTAKATGNLRQIGVLMASYTADNNNCLPLLIDWRQLGSSPDNFQFWQNLLRRQAGLATNGPANGLWLPQTFYDPAVTMNQHLWGGFGGNDSIMLGLGQPAGKDCQVQFGYRIARQKGAGRHGEGYRGVKLEEFLVFSGAGVCGTGRCLSYAQA